MVSPDSIRMNLFGFFVLLAYVIAFAFVLFIIYRFFFPPVIVVEQPIMVTSGWWPWTITSYNHWPSWYSSHSGDRGSRGCPSGNCSSPTHRNHLSPPWGGAGRGANTGGFHSSEKVASTPHHS